MRNLLTLLIFGLLFTVVACGPSQSTDTGNQENQEAPSGETAPKEESTSSVSLSGENYEITVLEDGILSPRKEMKGNVDGVDVVINYGSPSVKGRTIGQGLAPFGEIWRTGANKATTFEVKQDVSIEGQSLPAGKYSVFTIPGQDNWVIIFNKVNDQWGTVYDQAEDALRITVPASKDAGFQETMDFVVDGNKVVFRWGSWAVPFSVAAG